MRGGAVVNHKAEKFLESSSHWELSQLRQTVKRLDPTSG